MAEETYGESRAIMLVVNSYNREELRKVLVETIDGLPRNGSLKKEIEIAVGKNLAKTVNFVIETGMAEKILNQTGINKKLSAEVEGVLNQALSADGRKVIRVSSIRFDFIRETGMAAILVYLEDINIDAVLDGALQKYKQATMEKRLEDGKTSLKWSQKKLFQTLEKFNGKIPNAKKVKLLEKLYDLACDWDIPNKLLLKYVSQDTVGASNLRRINPDLGLKIMG